MPDTEAGTLAETVKLAGNGNHLDIGSLFGGSAILAGLVKKSNGLSGGVVCLDPLNGYYEGTRFNSSRDPSSGLVVNRETLQKNIDHFGVDDITSIVQKKSHPLPVEVASMKFSSVFIDGNHWQKYPLYDWEAVQPITEKFIIFHDCDQKHPAVRKAVSIACQHSDWELHIKNVSVVVVKRK